MNKFSLLLLLLVCIISANSQNKKDKAVYKPYDREKSFYHTRILKDVNEFEEQRTVKKDYTYLTVDFTGKKFPVDPAGYTQFWHGKPVSQGNAGTCWCFSATSFMESEIYRLHKKEVKLSEMYTVYWEYVDRAVDFVKTRGETYFNEGSEANAIPKIWRKYGIVPESAYPGKEEGRKFHSHRKMVQEMSDYLEGVKKNNAWNEDEVAATIKSILEDYMGAPPEEFQFDEKTWTPATYLKDYLKLDMDDYVSFMSTSKANFYEMSELVEADNWWHAANYYNIPLEDYFQLIVSTIKQGYTISICGDISEPGRSSLEEVSIIPTFDIPAEYINDDSRQYRLDNGATTDDHCIHLVGYKEIDGEYWFLMKDSGSSGFDGAHQGYCFYHQDYIKLKMMNILIHMDTAKKILDKIIK